MTSTIYQFFIRRVSTPVAPSAAIPDAIYRLPLRNRTFQLPSRNRVYGLPVRRRTFYLPQRPM